MLAVAVLVMGASLSNSLPSDFTIADGQDLIINSDIPISANRQSVSNGSSPSKSKRSTFSVNLFGIIPVTDVSAKYEQNKQVLLCGQPFGIKIYTEGVMVVGITDVKTENETVNAAKNAGIKKGDIILKANDKKLTSNEDLRQIIEQSEGSSITLLCKREETTFNAVISPVFCTEQNCYKAGIWVRDSSAGIGTLTFIDPDSGAFGGLGHSVCDVDTGKTLPILSGQALSAEIIGIKKGQKGAAGEIQGCFISNKSLGEINLNDQCGVFGRYEGSTDSLERAQVAMRQDVKKGKAEIMSAVSGKVEKYSCSIERISLKDDKQQNLTVRITDKRLLELTGGIVQGMSGSPIIQDGRLVGAVTYVFVDDPTLGYGIFAESMLEKAEQSANDFGQNTASKAS